MNINTVLKKLEDNEITSEEAFIELYPEPKKRIGKRATFIKMRIVIPEEGKGVNRFLKILFFLPFPIIFARMGIRLAGKFVKNNEVDMSEISKMLKYGKHASIKIDSEDAQIDIKII